MARQAASGSNSNQPEAGKSSKYYKVWMLVPMAIGMVRIITFPRSKSGIFDLTLNRIEPFSKVSLHRKHDKKAKRISATSGSIDFGDIWCYMQTI